MHSLLQRQLKQLPDLGLGGQCGKATGKHSKHPRHKGSHSHSVIRSDFYFYSVFYRNQALCIGGVKTLSTSLWLCYLSQILFLPVPYVSTIQSNDILEHVRDKITQREETSVGIKQCTVTWKPKQTFWQVLRTTLSAKKATFYRFYSDLDVSQRKHAVLHMFRFCEVKGGKSTLSKAT